MTLTRSTTAASAAPRSVAGTLHYLVVSGLCNARCCDDAGGAGGAGDGDDVDVGVGCRCSSNSAALEEFGGSVERVCDRCWASVQMAAADDRRPEVDHGDADENGDKDDDEAVSS